MPVSYDTQVIRPKQKYEWTKEMAIELSRCAADVKYFALNQCKVLHTKKGIIPVELRKYQMDLLELLIKHDRVISKCARQSGKTTITGIYALHKALFSDKRINIYICSNKGDSAKDFLERIKTIYRELPDYLKKGVKEWNKTSVTFDDDSTIHATTTTEDSVRGRSVNLLILDEFAHVAPHIAEAFWTSSQPSVAAGGAIVIISTPNGNTGQYYKLYSGAARGENEFAYHETKWNDPPDRDEKWKKKMIAETGLQKFLQEYECQFLGSSTTLINGETLEKIGKTVRPPEFNYPGLELWEKPKKNHIYVFGVDVSMGVGSDYSVIQIIDITNPKLLRQIGVFSDNYIRNKDFTKKIYDLAKDFNEAFVIIENNTYGHQICIDLWEEYQYEWMFREYGNPHRGVYAGTKTKLNSNSALKRALEENNLLLYDPKTLQELYGYVELGIDRYGSEDKDNAFDDRVAALRWAIYFLQTKYWLDLADYIRKERGVVGPEAEIREINEKPVFQPIIFNKAFREGESNKIRDNDGLIWPD